MKKNLAKIAGWLRDNLVSVIFLASAVVFILIGGSMKNAVAIESAPTASDIAQNESKKEIYVFSKDGYVAVAEDGKETRMTEISLFSLPEELARSIGEGMYFENGKELCEFLDSIGS